MQPILKFKVIFKIKPLQNTNTNPFGFYPADLCLTETSSKKELNLVPFRLIMTSFPGPPVQMNMLSTCCHGGLTIFAPNIALCFQARHFVSSQHPTDSKIDVHFYFSYKSSQTLKMKLMMASSNWTQVNSNEQVLISKIAKINQFILLNQRA